MKKSLYTVIPAAVRYDKNLDAEAKLLYGELLSNSDCGTCLVSNYEISEMLDFTQSSIEYWINQLQVCGHLGIGYENPAKRVMSLMTL